MVQLRQDDPVGDWTVPGVCDVGPGLFRIPLLWTRRGRTFGELDLLSRCLAVTETMAHLDVLALVGRLSRSEVDGVAHYTRT